ncbi:MAG: hypothetical protein IT280_02260 [Ignavibacteria bacterium]|nr:hypothetical protein [Ignavibacteria bacterium]
MKITYVYILGASANPDFIECKVPFKINSNEIFFGPCKKRLRQALREKFLNKLTRGLYIPNEDIFFVGLNSSNTIKTRKIVWAGRIMKMMTFGKAYNYLKGNKYKKLRLNNMSPLHLKPIYKDSKLIAYEFLKTLHIDNWISDIISKLNSKIEYEGNEIYVKEKYSAFETFDRDICFIFENIFFADYRGINIDTEILNIFKQAQSDTKNIDNYAIFGKQKNGAAIGKIGSWLELNDTLTEKIILLINERARKIIKSTNNLTEREILKKAKTQMQKVCKS